MRITGNTAEMLRAGQNVVLFLTWMIIALFEKGIYPQDWAKKIVIPIHKKVTSNKWTTTGRCVCSEL